MPVITVPEFQEMIPKLDNKAGTFLIKRLMHLSSVDRVNELYDRNSHLWGADFMGALMRDVGIDYSIGNPDRLARLPEGPFITVSNHPYGHLDGIMMVDLFGHLRNDYKLMVNQILARIRAAAVHFIEVIPAGDKQTEPKAASLSGIRETLGRLQEGHPVGFFPSGAVSDLDRKSGRILDRPWQDSVLRLIRKAGVPVVPVRFFDRNSMYFYRLGLIDWRMRLLRLCSEVFNKRGALVRLGIGETVSVERQRACRTSEDLSALLRNCVYDMPLPDSFVKRSHLPF